MDKYGKAFNFLPLALQDRSYIKMNYNDFVRLKLYQIQRVEVKLQYQGNRNQNQ